MAWQTANAQADRSTEERLASILERSVPELPPKIYHLGKAISEWWESEPGTAVIVTTGGSIDDRVLSEWILRTELERFGYKQARFRVATEPPQFTVDENWPSMGNSWPMERRVFLYDPGTGVVKLGPPASHHYEQPELADKSGVIHGWLSQGNPEGLETDNTNNWAGKGMGVWSIRATDSPGRAHLPALEEFLYNKYPEYRPSQPRFQNPAPQENPYEDEDLWHEAAVKTSTWNDIMAKAQRLLQQGKVTLLRNGYNTIVAHVIGDHGEYQSEIARDDPNSRAITQWTCECPWDQFAFQRTRQWKKYEARPCAHVLAAFWLSQKTPLDDDRMPGPPGQMPPGPQTPVPVSPFNQPGTGMMPGMGEGMMGQMPVQPPQTMTPGIPQYAQPQFAQPQPSQSYPLMAPPGENNVIPPYPLEGAGEQGQMPVSIPGGRPGPYPANPIQQPGTFSHVAGANDQFANSDMARIEEDTMGQSVGRDGAVDAGQWVDVPKNSIGEVMGQDPTTGWVEINFPLKGGPMTSYHVQCFVEPEKLTPMPNLKKPGPFIKRRV